MTEPVTLYNLYYLIDTSAWLQQRIGAQHSEHSNQLQEFTRCDVFDDYRPAMDIAVRMQLWCAAHGWPLADGATIEHDHTSLNEPITIVLVATTGFPRQCLALVSVDGDAPEIYADVTTDDGYWLDSSTIQITCPGGHTWTWNGDRDLYAADGTSHRIADLFGPNGSVISRCCDCAAFDDGHTDNLCPCPGFAVYCPACGQRCTVALPEIPTYEESN